MKKKAKGTLPKWWTNIIKDLEIATQVSRKSFVRSNVVVGVILDDITGLSVGYLIRLKDSRVGYYSVETTGKDLPAGSHIKGELPDPEKIVEEPSIESYIFEGIKENVALIPRMWLRKVIGKIVNGQPITKKEDLKAFPEWVLLPVDKRSDKVLIDILYRLTQYEGMKGLARFNKLPDPKMIEIIKENLSLIPSMRFKKAIRKFLNDQHEKVFLPVDEKSSEILIDILYRVTRYEGMKGLARFNDLH